MEDLVRVDGQEMRELVEREAAKQEGFHQQIIREYQEK